MKNLIDANERHCRMIRNPLYISFISHFIINLSSDFKFQLMTSFCLQITRMIYSQGRPLSTCTYGEVSPIFLGQNAAKSDIFGSKGS